MLWQIPGGHMATTSETLNNYDVSTYSSAAGPYFLGDSNIGTNLNAIIPDHGFISLKPFGNMATACELDSCGFTKTSSPCAQFAGHTT